MTMDHGGRGVAPRNALVADITPQNLVAKCASASPGRGLSGPLKESGPVQMPYQRSG